MILVCSNLREILGFQQKEKVVIGHLRRLRLKRPYSSCLCNIPVRQRSFSTSDLVKIGAKKKKRKRIPSQPECRKISRGLVTTSLFSFTDRWREVLTSCTTGVVKTLQKLVEIMPDTVVVGFIKMHYF